MCLCGITSLKVATGTGMAGYESTVPGPIPASPHYAIGVETVPIPVTVGYPIPAMVSMGTSMPMWDDATEELMSI